MQADPTLRRRTGQTGTTLAEFAMTVFMLGIVLTICFRLLVTTDGALTDADVTGRSTDQARLAVQQMDRQIRSGNVLNDPAQEGLVSGVQDTALAAEHIRPGLAFRVYTQANGAQRCVQWRVNTADKTLETRGWSENYLVDGDVSPWRVVAENIRNSTTTPAFQRNANYGERLIQIMIIANANPAQRKDVVVESSVTGRNTQFGYSPSTCLSTPPY